MKPIEIHIEGYKIVISKEDEKTEDAVTIKEEKISVPPYYPTYPIYPSTGERNPFATWTSDDVFNTITTNPPMIVRDTMVGKKDKDE